MSEKLPNPEWLLERAQDAVTRAQRAGADAAEAMVRAHWSTGVSARLGVLEDVDASEGRDLSIKLYIGQRSASLSTGDFSAEAIDAVVERAVAMARLAPENLWAGLAPADMVAQGPFPDLDQYDASPEPDPDTLLARALEVEDAARALSGVTNSDGAGASASGSAQAMVTSNGFAAAIRSTAHMHSVSVIAGEGDQMQRDHDWHSARHLSDLEAATIVGTRAGERTIARLNPQSMASGRLPVVFDPRVSGSLISHLISAMAGSAIARGRSMLAAHERAKLFPDAISISDDPHLLRGLRSHAVDGEGLATHPRLLVDRGVIGDWLCDLASARQLGRAPTGNGGFGGGVATGNLALTPGTVSRADLIADIKDGVLITELIGQGVDLLTGDYSRGAAGFRIRNGEVAEAVSGFTVAGNLLTMFADLTAADDLDTRGATHVPSLRTNTMTIAGG